MVAKRTRTFIDIFLIEDKSKETLEVKNPKECWEWYNKAMDELDELERLARIEKAFEDAKNKEFGIFEYIPYAGAKTKVYPITEYEYNKVIEWAESEI